MVCDRQIIDNKSFGGEIIEKKIFGDDIIEENVSGVDMIDIKLAKKEACDDIIDLKKLEMDMTQQMIIYLVII